MAVSPRESEWLFPPGKASGCFPQGKQVAVFPGENEWLFSPGKASGCFPGESEWLFSAGGMKHVNIAYRTDKKQAG